MSKVYEITTEENELGHKVTTFTPIAVGGLTGLVKAINNGVIDDQAYYVSDGMLRDTSWFPCMD